MDENLKQRFSNLSPVIPIKDFKLGTPLCLLIKANAQDPALKPISSMHALSQRGMNLLDAKRAVEDMIQHGSARVRCPTVESFIRLNKELKESGVESEIVPE